MNPTMKTQSYEIGMVGLGVMGRNLLLNMADHGHSVAGYDKDITKVAALRQEAEHRDIRGVESVSEFVGLLRVPRAVMLLVPAGAPVDAVIHDLLPCLARGDLIIDAGNSYFDDTNLRAEALAERKIQFLGVGVSGGEYGARHGPSIMPGGPKDAYERIRAILEAVAAKVDGEPCVTWLGPGAAGHFVKMVHNGIEYGLMQSYAEGFEIMKLSKSFPGMDMQAIAESWRFGSVVRSWLLDLIADGLSRDPQLAGIRGYVEDTGEGRWTVEAAIEESVPAPVITQSLFARFRSRMEDTFADKMLAMMRNQFGGHAVVTEKK